MFDTWQELAIAGGSGIIMLVILGVIISNILKRRDLKVKAGKDGVEVSTDGDEVVPVKKTALTDEELDRIAERLNRHTDCVQRDFITSMADGHTKVVDGVIVALQHDVEDKKNGNTEQVLADLVDHRKAWRGLQSAKVAG
jgi:hypothetical protein